MTEARSYLWVFFAATALLPVWVALALDPPFLFPRYFLVSIVFVPLLVAGFASPLGRPWPAVVLVVWLGANGHSLLQFAREGRGCYEEALRFLLVASDDDVVTLGSDHDLRNERILGFYRGRMGTEGKRLRYVKEEERVETGIGFWIGSYEGSNKTGRSKRTAAPTPRHAGAGAGAGEPSYLSRISLAVNFPPFSM